MINKAGGLVYQRSFGGRTPVIWTRRKLTPHHTDGLPHLTSNEYLVLAGTLHGIHAITSRLSPIGASSGVQVIEGETFKLNVHLTHTGTIVLPPTISYALISIVVSRNQVRPSDFTRGIDGGRYAAKGIRDLRGGGDEESVPHPGDANTDRGVRYEDYRSPWQSVECREISQFLLEIVHP